MPRLRCQMEHPANVKLDALWEYMRKEGIRLSFGPFGTTVRIDGDPREYNLSDSESVDQHVDYIPPDYETKLTFVRDD